LEIAQRTRDSHFPPAAATAGLRLHFQCLDDPPQGYILKWLDTQEANLLEPGVSLVEAEPGVAETAFDFLNPLSTSIVFGLNPARLNRATEALSQR
jgi:hypothetical protein